MNCIFVFRLYFSKTFFVILSAMVIFLSLKIAKFFFFPASVSGFFRIKFMDISIA